LSAHSNDAAAPPPTISAAERRERTKAAPGLAPTTLKRLAAQHPTAAIELHFGSPFQLIVAVVLSAQTTDVGVNKATPKLFADYPDAKALAAVEPLAIEPYVAPLGFFRSKARSIVGLARALVEHHGGEVPQTLAELVKLPGVGRKTANVVLGVLWNKPEGVVVDTHVMRLSQRLGWTRNREPEKIEPDLAALLPRNEWDHAAHVLIFHGRRCCFARKPDCAACRVNDVCPCAFAAELVGRKARPTDTAKPAAKKPGAKAIVKRTAAKTPAKKTAKAPPKKKATPKIAVRRRRAAR
jgi:endonuclease-3